MRRILITGSTGFVGRHAMRAIAEGMASGDRIAGIGRENPVDAPECAEFANIDLLDGSTLASFVRDFAPTHVLHLAAMASVAQAATTRADTWRQNLIGVMNLAEALDAHAVEGSTFVFVSSSEVYGRAFLSGTPLDEAVTPLPVNTYARTKLAGESLLADLLPPAGIRLITLRPFNHIGPGQDERFVVASFAAQIARIEAGLVPAVVEVGDLSAQRDFLDVADVVTAYAALILNGAEVPGGSLFNIASGTARPISALLDGLRARARRPFEVRVAKDRLRRSEIASAVGDASALRRAIGWAPQVAFDDSLARILDDARARLAV